MTLTYCSRFLLTTILPFTIVTSQIRATTDDVCSPNYPGGPPCDCSPNSLQPVSATCSGKALISVPTPFPNCHTIDLSKNAITEILTGPFNNLTFLTDLNLEHNDISHIQQGAFGRLMKLKKLYLYNNNLRSVDSDVFSHLPSLSILDLSFNLITTVDRYSFFYLPRLNHVNMESNVLNCGCEERFFREFMDLRNGRLSISNALCGNFDNISITDVNENSWSSLQCEGQHLFRPQSSRKCHSCQNAKSVGDCQTKEQQQCPGLTDVCYIRQVYNDNETLGVGSGCLDYAYCITSEAANSATCKSTPPSTCYFCNNAPTFTNFDIANTTRFFDVLALITLSMDMTDGLANNESIEYQKFVTKNSIEIQDFLFGNKGSFLVQFIELRAPRVTIAVKITASTMWFISDSDVKSAMQTTLKSVSINGQAVETIHILTYHAGWCKADVVQSNIYGTLSWSQVTSDTVSVLVCPFQSPGGEYHATRYCDTLGLWAATNFTECSRNITRELQSIAEQDITTDNVENVSSTVNELSLGWERYTSEDVTLTVDIVEQILNTTSSSPSVINNTINAINNILFVGILTLSQAQLNREAASRLASVIDNFSNSVDVMNDDYTVVKENVAMFVTNVNVSSFDGRSMTLSSHSNRDGPFSDDKLKFNTSAVETENSQSGILLRPTLFDDLLAAGNRRVNHISLYALRDSKLYNSIIKLNTTIEIRLPGNKIVLATRAINSYVIGATVPGVSLNNLKEPVIITFLHFEEGVNAECVYWNDTNRDWSSEGCSINVTTSNLTVCHCNHLTNFALLMDVYGSGGTLTKSDLLALSIISYVGCGVSCLAVILTLLTYTCFNVFKGRLLFYCFKVMALRFVFTSVGTFLVFLSEGAFGRLKKDNPSKILMNLCGAIGLVNVVFIVGVQEYMVKNHTGCKIVAVLLHYVLLAVMCWMMVEAFYMYLALVKVFNTHVAHFQLKSSLFGWGIPLVIVIITLSINTTDNYGIQPGGICWLERIPFYAAFLGPVCGTMVFNSVVFILVLRQIFRCSSKKLTKSDSNRGTAVRVRGAISLIILLGLTWLFAILAIGDYGKVFHYLFALTNTLQGLFIFIFYCVLKTEAQNAWKMCLPCCTTPYERNRTTNATSKAYAETKIGSKATASTGYSETEIESNATASTDVTAESDTIREVKQEPTKTEREYKDPVPHREPVFRGNWQLNINTANTPGRHSKPKLIEVPSK